MVATSHACLDHIAFIFELRDDALYGALGDAYTFREVTGA
jgi:hypothetical protein